MYTIQNTGRPGSAHSNTLTSRVKTFSNKKNSRILPINRDNSSQKESIVSRGKKSANRSLTKISQIKNNSIMKSPIRNHENSTFKNQEISIKENEDKDQNQN